MYFRAIAAGIFSLINHLKALLGLTSEASLDVGDSNIQIAGLALLIEVSKSDHTVDVAEQEKIIALATNMFDIDLEQLDSLLKEANAVSDESTSLYSFTSVINQYYSETEKFNLILFMWQVAMADDHIDKYEEHLIRRVSDLIYLPHVRFMKAKHDAANIPKGRDNIN